MAVRMKALIDAKFESKRNAEEARREVLVKAILEAKEAAASFMVDVADIFDTYHYIKKMDATVGSAIWHDMCHKCSKFNIDFANAFPIDNFNTRWVFRSYSANGCYLVVARNFVALRKAPVLYEDFEPSTLSVNDAEDFFTYITQFNEGFPKYVEHFFKLVEDIEL